jgi:hypothetical protein
LSVIVLSLLQVATASAQQAEGRIALVIGNSAYPDAGAPLPHAINDATAMAEEFRGKNFTVEFKTNLSKLDMEEAIKAFSAKIKKGATALFYFSGLGIQAAHQTYLLPVDAQIWTEADVRRNGFSADTLLADMHRKGAKVKIVIVDAARRNPFERRFRTVPAGLTPLSPPTDSLVIYSAAVNKLINDRYAAGQSLFASELIKELRSSSGSSEEIFNRTRVAVSRASNGEQVPWVSSSLQDIFYVSAGNAGGSDRPPPPSTLRPPSSQSSVPAVSPPEPPQPSPPAVSPKPSVPSVSPLPSPPQALTQTVRRAPAHRLPGRYIIDGTNPNGSRYRGSVTITANGATYNVLWRISNGDTYRGKGRLRGNTLTVDWGQRHPVIYRVEDDGTLRGTWANGRAKEYLTPD